MALSTTVRKGTMVSVTPVPMATSPTSFSARFDETVSFRNLFFDLGMVDTPVGIDPTGGKSNMMGDMCVDLGVNIGILRTDPTDTGTGVRPIGLFSMVIAKKLSSLVMKMLMRFVS